MTDEELDVRISMARETEEWIALYKEYFGKSPEFRGDNWGSYPIDKIIDALVLKKPFKDSRLPRNAVA